MKKTTQLVCAFFTMISFLVHAQNQAEMAPNIEQEKTPLNFSTEAIWDIQNNLNISSAANGNAGMAGVVLFNNEFWVSEWASDTILRYTATGTLIDKFVIAGLVGTRSFATDGNVIFAGNNSNRIFRINPTTKQLDANPQIVLSGSALAARYIGYDPYLNSGQGGFWIGSFGNDITAVDMNGQTISTIPIATTGRSSIYGASVDYFTAGGPYLWIFDQGGSNNCDLVQLSLPSGTPTGVVHDVFPDISTTHSLATSLAGGVFVTNNVVAGKASIVCLAQGDPSNVIITYELGENSFGFNENKAVSFSVFPNPTKDVATIRLKNNTNSANYQLVDINGKLVQKGKLENQESRIDLSGFSAGTYILQVLVEGKNIGEQRIVKNQ